MYKFISYISNLSFHSFATSCHQCSALLPGALYTSTPNPCPSPSLGLDYLSAPGLQGGGGLVGVAL